jgi:hypothetical protein
MKVEKPISEKDSGKDGDEAKSARFQKFKLGREELGVAKAKKHLKKEKD